MSYKYPYLNVDMPEKDEVLQKTPNPATKDLIEKIAADGNETYLDRFASQQPQCSFGLKGTCCRMCQWGPCRITEKSPRGICGRSQDEIVISNIIRSLVSGLAAHGRHAHEIIYTIKGIAEGKINLKLKGVSRIMDMAEKLGLEIHNKTVEQLAGEIADILIEDLSRMDNKNIRLLDVFAPRERKDLWNKIDVLPRSASYEIMEALHMTTLGSCTDWKAIAGQEKRSALAYCYSTLFGSSLATEMLFGIPEPKETEVNYGIMKEDHVNILVHGHSPVMIEKVLEKIKLPEIQQLAKDYGAKGIVVGGLCCTGTELLARYGIPTVTNILGQEFVIGTGAVDCIVVDMQCVIPGMKILADCYGTKVITTCNSNRIPGAIHLPFDPEKPDTLDKDAYTIAKTAVEAFKDRDRSKIKIPRKVTKAYGGWSFESIVNALGGIKNIANLLKDGTLKGIATVVGCNTPKVAYESNHVTIARKLIESDILILTTGCSSHALLNAGLCSQHASQFCGDGLKKVIEQYNVPPVMAVGGCVDNTRTLRLFIALSEEMGIAIKDMPFMFVGPEPGNEKTVGQGLSFLMHGVSNLVGFPAPIPVPNPKPVEGSADGEMERGSNNIADYFGGNGALEELGAKIYTEPYPELAAQAIKMHIKRKRNNLGWK
ncbi:MAG TPA: anaerobic carbon-monoxide dehydrogenase catalytic subunit [Clostridiaceae bacterium]|nr:anaerobic carbon-monoxide dehydrogenase catalytic subunit [Clostridiaceae bacterium]